MNETVNNIKKFTIGKPFETGAVVMDIKPFADAPEYISVKENKIILTFALSDDDIIYGLGEQMGGINKKGKLYKSFCSDEPCHTEDKEALYGAHNFFILIGEAKFGIFIDFPGIVTWDMGYTHKNEIAVTVEGKNADIYQISGKDEKEIIKNFRKLIGKSYLPPMWAFGYQQSRWSYKNQDEIKRVLEGYKSAGIPLDTIYLDIDYMDNFKDFTIDDKAFPNFENFVKELKDDGIRLIPIIDAGVKVEDGYDIYEEGKKHNYFCKDKKGDDFKAGVWPGICCFPDFLDEKSGKWFGDKFNILTEKGIEGFWIDMNEPALFFSPESLKEAYKYVEENKKENPSCWDFFALKDKFLSISNNNDDYKNMHHLNGTVSHYDVHNLYGYKMMESVRKSLPEDTLLFSRASYIGSHRYGGIWTGDNHSWWSHILLNLRMLPSLNMCGFIYTGADCGGFNCNASRELLLRWMALSVFTPLFRNHSATGTREQEAFAFENTEDFKNIIKVRYRLIPYLYSLAEKCCNEFEMMFSPLSFTFPNDKIAREIDDQLLVGEDFMIAPVYEPNKSGRMVYLPEDMTLYKLSGDKIFSKEMNKGLHYVEIALNEVPIFLRKGKKLPLCSSANRVRDIDFTNITWLS